jgi:3-oxoacyl-[acyl-carrier protein] reductase
MLKGKNAIITGGTAGIGKGLAIEFVKNGASVVIVGTNETRAKEVCEECNGAKIYPEQKVTTCLLDVSNTSQVKDSFDKILKEFGSIDILINNAGIVRDNLLMKIKEEDFDKVINVNLKSVHNTSQALVRSMMRQRKGKIINITSVVGLMGNAGQTNYAASKAGIIGFTKSLAKEVSKRGINVNCIAPGYIQTPMTDALPDTVKNSILEGIPLNRMGSTKDIANAALFLASDNSDYITGQTLIVDGGMVM